MKQAIQQRNKTHKLVMGFWLLLIAPYLAIASDPNFEAWLENQYEASQVKFLKNISPADAIPGTVVASPDRVEPDYYYNWIRDAALVMQTIGKLRKHDDQVTGRQIEQSRYLQYLYDYVKLSHIHQKADAIAGLGEVKFHVDGTAFKGPWGRPQNDGPALRALALIEFSRYLLEVGQEDYVRTQLYDNKLPSKSVIKNDLEYVSHNWQNQDFCLWEEVRAHHFFTRMAQRKALEEGAWIANRLGDSGAASWYSWQASLINNELEKHWTQSRGNYITAHLNRNGGVDYKQGIDASVILAAAHFPGNFGKSYQLSDDRFLASLQTMRETYQAMYRINQVSSHLAPGIGRYPEDRYDGYSTGGEGNPWFLLTSEFANYLYQLADYLYHDGKITVTETSREFWNQIYHPGADVLKVGQVVQRQDEMFMHLLLGLKNEGDAYLKRVRQHTPKDGSMSEQFNRNTGHMQGASNLTWSHAALINAYLSRSALQF